MTDQASTGPWPATTELPRYAPLAHDVEADVCVVGAGIAGLTTAFLLAREGRRVVVLDDGPIGGGETGRTTAHLSPVLGTRYYELAQLHGEEGARTIASSHMAAVDFIEQTVAAERIACDFSRRDGWLFAPPDGPRDELERELEAVHRAGIPGVELHASAPLSTISRGPALRFPDQAQFHPLRYVSALARDLVARGGRIHCATRAAAFEVGPLATVATEAGPKVSAPWLVVATNSPVNDVVKMHTKLAPYRTYVVLLPVERDAVPRALFWDTADPYHYVRRLDVDSAEAGGHDLILVGGEDHKTGQADDADARYARLEEWGRARFPVRGPRVRAWSGQVLEPMDGIAFVGRNPGAHDHVLIATGDAGNGMTHGTIAGMLLADLIAGRENPWAALYDPARKTLRAAGTFLRENLNVAARYAEWFAPADAADEDAIAPGTGAIVRAGVRKFAIYRDEAGAVHRHSAACPHLGCVVHWNSAERTWDCPCHGSRFDPMGGVINGPARSGLAPIAGERAEPA